MGDSYSTSLSGSLKARARGYPAYYLGDLIPIGFIKPYEFVSASGIDEPPITSYNLTTNGNFGVLRFSATDEDLEGQIPDASGKKERIYTAYINYVWLTDKAPLVGGKEAGIGYFEIANSSGVLVRKIHVVNERKFFPGPPNDSAGNYSTESEVWMLPGNNHRFSFSIPYLGDPEDLPSTYIPPSFSEIRWSSGVVKLLPTLAISLWLAIGGGVDLIASFDPADAFQQFAENFGFLGAGVIGAFGSATAEQTRRNSPVIYKPFNLKFGYSVVGSSDLRYDDKIEITFNDLYERVYDDKNNYQIKPKYIKGGNYIILNKQIGSSSDFISKVFSVSLLPFNFSDGEKRYIGKGITNSVDFRDGILASRFLLSSPVPFSVVKEKAIPAAFMRQVSKFRYPNTSIPEEHIPNGDCNIQIWLPTKNLDISQSRFTSIFVYVTYNRVRRPNFRQVNSYRIIAAAQSASIADAKAQVFYQGSAFAYDAFYIDKSLRYSFNASSFPSTDSPIDFNVVNNLIGLPAIFDTGYVPETFKVSTEIIGKKLYETQDVPKVSTYRLSSRRAANGSETFSFTEGVFVAAAKFRYINPDGLTYSDYPGGIGFIDGLGNLTMLIDGGKILDQEWWKNYFGSVGQTLSVQGYTDDYGTKIVKYDRCIATNSLFTDDEKIGYDEKLASALSAIVPMSSGGPGIGICLLDFIDTKNFNIKSSVGSFTKNSSSYDPNLNYYLDLSEAYFKNDVNPTWRFNIVQLLNPPITVGGNIANRGTITAESFCFDVLPVSLTSKGRVFYEGMGGLGAAYGVAALEQLYVRSNAYDVKLGFASDYQNLMGLYAHQVDGELRAYSMRTSDFLIFNISSNTGYDYKNAVISSNKKTKSNKASDVKWFGLPVDKTPFPQYGLNVIETEGDFVPPNKTDVKVQYRYLYIDGKNIKKDGTGNLSIDLESSYRIANIQIYIDKKIARNLANFNSKADLSYYRYSITFDYPQGSTLSEGESIAFASFNHHSGDYAYGIMSSVVVPNYSAKKIYLKGDDLSLIKDLVDSGDKPRIVIAVYLESNYENISFNTSDCFPAIDGFTQGYISVINRKDTYPSLDIYTTGDHDQRWRLYRSIFQLFNGETIYQCVLKADQKGKKLHLMFSLNGNLLFKSIEGWTVSSLYYAGQKSESENAFLLGNNNTTNYYALSSTVYDRLQNIGSKSPAELDHSARLASAYVVQANYIDNEFLQQEYVNTLVTNAVKSALQQANAAGKDAPKTVVVEAEVDSKKKNLSVSIPDQITSNSKLISPRIYIDRIPTSTDSDINWPVNQPYTFEVLNSGSFICFVLREGSVHVMESGDGKNWGPGFGLDSLYGFRPIKWSNDDQDSVISTARKTFSVGSCPPIDNISSCYDCHSGRLTLFYVMDNAIFGQNFYMDQIKGNMFYNLQTINSDNKDVRSKPYYIIGQLPPEMIESAHKGNNYVNFGIISEGNVKEKSSLQSFRSVLAQTTYLENTSNLKTNGKAPGACFIGAGLIRMYYEDENDQIRGVTIKSNEIVIDLLMRSASVDAGITNG